MINIYSLFAFLCHATYTTYIQLSRENPNIKHKMWINVWTGVKYTKWPLLKLKLRSNNVFWIIINDVCKGKWRKLTFYVNFIGLRKVWLWKIKINLFDKKMTLFYHIINDFAIGLNILTQIQWSKLFIYKFKQPSGQVLVLLHEKCTWLKFQGSLILIRSFDWE